MTVNNVPDIDPADNASLSGALKFAFFKMMQNTDGMLPAKVIKYDRALNRVQVQPMIAVVTTGNAQISRAQIASVPVMMLGGGGFALSFNLNAGDMGWILANDRDISLFLQNYSEAAPNTARVKNFADALFIPDVMHGLTIDPLDSNNVVLQNTDGTVKISLGVGKITVTAPVVEINGLNSGTMSVITPASGTLHVVGNLNATGSITPFVP